MYGSSRAMAPATGSFLPRILSAPSILAVEQLHCAQLNTSTAATSGHKRPRTEDSDSGPQEPACAADISHDSGASEMTGDAAALADGAGSAAAFPLKG